MSGSAKVKSPACVCGKAGWLSKADADQIVVKAKISFALYGNQKRREQRSYECLERPGTWHVTSQADRKILREHTAAKPTYRVDDDEAAREFLSRAIFYQEMEPWTDLLSVERAHQTLRVLGEMHQASLQEANQRLKAISAGGNTVPSEVRRERRAAYREWCTQVQPMRDALVRRISQARDAVTEANIARTEGRHAKDGSYLRALVRRLALEIEGHRLSSTAEGRTPSPADERLWAVLSNVRMPRGNTLRGPIDDGHWRPYPPGQEHPLDGDIDWKRTKP